MAGAMDLGRCTRSLSMSFGVVCRVCFRNTLQPCRNSSKASWTSRREKPERSEGDAEFRTLNIPGLKPRSDKKSAKPPKRLVPPPRHLKMAVDQDWTKVWPTATTFKWSVIPFPVRQGFIDNPRENDGIVPGRYANAELMKIPNFLHLTPAHVKKHCAAIKKFCTPWPAGLETQEQCQKHFPLTVQISDYCFAGPSVFDHRARLVTIKLKLCSLELDYHARDKIIRLVGDRYDPATDELTISSDRCPTKRQNWDYTMYLLTALYHEAWKVEPWEAEKAESDHEKYFWNLSRAKVNVVELLQRIGQTEQKIEQGKKRLKYLPAEMSEERLLTIPQVQNHKEVVSSLFNEGESVEAIIRYKDSVKQLLGLRTGLS